MREMVLYITNQQFSSVQLLSCVWLFATPWTAARQTSLSITNSRSLLKVTSIESVILSNISSSVVPFSSHLQSFPASRTFPVSQFFTSSDQNIRASALASVLPVNIQDWLPLQLTDLISFQFKGLSRVFSNTKIKSINSLALSFLYSPTLTSICGNWKSNSFD